MKVLVAEKIAASGIEMLKGEFDVDVKTDLTPEDLVAEIPAYDALIVRSATRATREVIEAGVNLKIIGRAGVGVDNVDVQAATERGIIVCNAPTSNIVSAAEHTVALMLASARNIPAASASMKQCKWERSKFTGTELYEKTLAIFGLGRIGSLVAERARSFGMHLVGYDPYTSPERAQAMGIELYENVDDMLPLADFITVHLPKTKETIGMFGAEQFAKMKDGVRVINTARGGIYQVDALADALKSGKVASAAIDVYEVEPCTDSPLTGIDNAILTPHLGASTSEAQDRAGEQIAEYVAAGLRGEMVPTAVNIAPVSPEVLEKVGPYVEVAENLGKMVAQMARHGVESLDIKLVGALAETDTRILKTAVLKGMLTVVGAESVNFVNADYYAEQRGIVVTETKQTEARDYVSLVGVTAHGAGGDDVEIAAALIGKKNEPRLVSLFGYDIDMAPSDNMAFFKYPDRPGMIGKVGTQLGSEGINIGSMQVGRTDAGGTALMGITVDSPISAELLAQISEQGEMEAAWSVEL
ncbi:MAG: phosphoglycerate dehydrogenase [Actinobacteria bacterium HGW-Actinobacteria-9]|jgi:D-3-phosphoglycerate dehydrogenase|nr:MAG: phosphoglycerate dehydrogenase [Actinobacteria bacterium HGW-Actinobacteria-9]